MSVALRRGRLGRMARDAWWSARSLAYVDLQPDLSRTVFIAGAGRSGTTWAQELVDRHHDHRVLFEPFTPHRVPVVSHFHQIQYLHPDDAAEAYLRPVESILRGRVRNQWIDHRNYVHVARRRLVKDIRSNLMLCWLARRIPALRIVWLVRHPVAVVESSLRLGWRDHLDDLLSQPRLVSDHLADRVGNLRGLHDTIGRRAAQWAIEHRVPFRQLAAGEVHLVFYEDLVRRPVEVASQMLAFLGQTWDDRAQQVIARPSHMSRPGGTATAMDAVTSWRTRMDPEAIERVLTVIGDLGLDGLYGADGMPDHRRARELLGA